jgi:hypothetical protein
MRFITIEPDLIASEEMRKRHLEEDGWYYCGYCGRATKHFSNEHQFAGCGNCNRVARRLKSPSGGKD